jgi:predicted dithiol-disulfide oxidoreductase (DUF899 family)
VSQAEWLAARKELLTEEKQSGYARGLDILIGTYNYLDFVPKGRDEDGLDSMSWVRHHDRYDDALLG